MKYCPKCDHLNSESAERCSVCNAILNTENEAVDSEAVKIKPIYPLFFILIPSLLTIVYGFLLKLNFLPDELTVGALNISLYPLFQSPATTVIGILFLFIVPLIFLTLLIGRIDQRKEAKEQAEFKRNNLGVGAYEDWTADKEEFIDESEGFRYSKFRQIDKSVDKVSAGAEDSPLSEITNDLVEFLACRGLSVSAECARALLSAMAASRMIWVTGKKAAVSRRVITAVAEYFGRSVKIDPITDEVVSPQSLVIRGAGAERYESDFACDVYSAHYAEKNICFAALENVNGDKLSDFFGEYMESTVAGDREKTASILRVTADREARFAYDGKLKLPQNVWYILFPTELNKAFARPADAVPVDFSSVSEVAPSGVESEKIITAPTVECFKTAVRKAKDVNFIPEEYWKKMDVIEEYIAGRVKGYVLDNISIRKIESFVGAYMAMGGELFNAIDYVVSAKILPSLYGCKKELITGDENGLAALIDRTFGLDNMPLSLECARKLSAV